MASDLERCCECDDPTGRAGRGDDSIYAEVVATGDEIGPLCSECFNRLESEGKIHDGE